MGRRWALLAGLMLSAAAAIAKPGAKPLPIIDMHVHAGRADRLKPVAVCPGNRPMTYPAIDPRDASSGASVVLCDRPILSPTTSAGLRDGTIAELRRHNVRRAVLAGRPEFVREWMTTAPGLFIPSAEPQDTTDNALEALRKLHAAGRAAVFAEFGAQYSGLRADDPKLDAFWTLAETLDVPVGIHLGEGAPGRDAKGPADHYRAGLTSPFQLEEVLVRHPRLRIYVMHAASPLTDEMIAMLFEYPGLYVDVGANVWNMPRAQFHDQLKRMVDAGFSTRILFGSDQTMWPQGIGLAIETIREAPFLTARQKRDIFYNNAARFLRLTKEEIAADHR